MIIWDEYEYGKQIYNDGHVKTKKWQTKELKCLIKYMLSKECKPKEIREKLELCCNDDIRYLKDHQRKYIFSKYIQQCKKDEIINKKRITIYKDEIEQIKQLKNVNAEKVMFVLLVLCKWYGDLQCFSVSRNDLAKEVKIKNIKLDDLQSILTSLTALKYVKSDVNKIKDEKSHKNYEVKKQMWSIPFLQNDGEIAFTINNYVNVVYRYLNHVYGGYFECDVCKGMFKANNNKQQFCSKCSAYHPIINKKIVCVDCGKEVEIDARNMTKSRCNECQVEYRKKWDRERKQKA
jgi:hypothetical protein